ncbi:hypothetical protein [Streptomyces sp. NBC_00299]|uniref:hypothetical protein n=1 Tax=Streptomyces sp. NBC_00299 TaxID=2975705 RepID=UPI002E2DEEFA|nr:hypothetical protein [Streptomyces sp. NBC_00299]
MTATTTPPHTPYQDTHITNPLTPTTATPTPNHTTITGWLLGWLVSMEGSLAAGSVR